MNTRQTHHLSTQLRAVKPAYLIGISVVSTAVCVYALRANNLEMVRLREAVYVADKNGQDVQRPLQTLQSYVTSHMNTNLSTGTSVYPPIQLKYTYERLVKAQSDAVAAANKDVYSQAQIECERQNSADFSGRNRIPCIENYVQSHTTTTTPIADGLYKFSFASPRWSPDVAGWSMLLAVLTGTAGIALFAIKIVLRKLSK